MNITMGFRLTDNERLDPIVVPSLSRLRPDGQSMVLTSREPQSERTAWGEIVERWHSHVADGALLLIDECVQFTDPQTLARVKNLFRSDVDVIVMRAAVDDQSGAVALSSRALVGMRAAQITPAPSRLSDIVRAARKLGLSIRQEYGLLTAHGKAPKEQGSAPYYSWERPELVALVPRDSQHILDVGCGAGNLGVSLKRQLPGTHVCGIELVPDVARTAALRLDDVWQLDLDHQRELPVAREYFDVIIFADVLEHLRDPETVLRDLLTYLSPAGVVVASVPNTAHWSILAPLLGRDRWTYEDAGLLDRTHVHLFTHFEAREMFDRVGLSEIWHLGASQVPGQEVIVAPLVRAAALLGADEEETRLRLDVYQYHFGLRRSKSSA